MAINFAKIALLGLSESNTSETLMNRFSLEVVQIPCDSSVFYLQGIDNSLNQIKITEKIHNSKTA